MMEYLIMIIYIGLEEKKHFLTAIMIKQWTHVTENKIADKITSEGKTNKNSKELQKSERKEVYMPIEKSQQIIDDLKLI